VFENRVLRIIFGPERDEVSGDWRKMHNEELHNLYSSPSIIRMIKVKEDEMGRACSTHEAKRNAYRILVEKPEGKRPLERLRYRWKDNIKTDLRGIGGGGMDWTDLAQDRDRWRALVNTVMHLRVS
jgi:hypothetical protein